MKRFTLLLCTFMVAAVLNAQVTTTVDDGHVQQSENKKEVSQVVQFSEENHDFGKIPYGKPQEFDVVMTNVSKDSVKIENVKVGCGCTTPKYEQNKTYAPGEKFRLTLGFNGYADGPFEKSVTVFFNGGMEKQLKFHGVGYKIPETPAPANEGIQKLKSTGN